MEPYFLGVQHMKPEEKAKQLEEEGEEVEGQKKKPYIFLKLTKLASLEEITQIEPSQTS
jgi:hypothetical protein